MQTDRNGALRPELSYYRDDPPERIARFQTGFIWVGEGEKVKDKKWKKKLLSVLIPLFITLVILFIPSRAGKSFQARASGGMKWSL